MENQGCENLHEELLRITPLLRKVAGAQARNLHRCGLDFDDMLQVAYLSIITRFAGKPLPQNHRHKFLQRARWSMIDESKDYTENYSDALKQYYCRVSYIDDSDYMDNRHCETDEPTTVDQFENRLRESLPIGHLKDRDYHWLALRYCGGMTCKAIGELCGLTEAAVWKRMKQVEESIKTYTQQRKMTANHLWHLLNY